MLEKRKAIVEKFSTFVKTYTSIQDKRNTSAIYQDKWVTDPQLRANITNEMEKYPNQNEEFWINYFVKAVKNNSDSFAEKHLLAYLEEACYRGANSIDDKCLKGFKSTRQDCFQIAREAAKENWQKIFNAYNPDKKTTLLYWAKYKLGYAIKDKLREGREFNNSSDWRILQCTKKALKTALQKCGTKEPEFSYCVQAWQGFTEVYPSKKITSQRQLPEPTEKKWAGITDYYNSLVLPEDDRKTVDEIKKLLNICIQALRAKDKIKFIPLNCEDSQLVKLEIAEEQKNWHLDVQKEIECSELSEKMMVVLGKALASLKPPSIDVRKMLILEHGLIKLNQTDIGKEFNMEQYQVSRFLSKYQRILVGKIISESLDNQYNVTPDIEVIKRACKQLDGWLNSYFQKKIIYPFLQTTLRLHPQINQDISILQWYFGTNPPIIKKVEKLIEEFNLVEETELETKLALVQKKLQNQSQLTQSQANKNRLLKIKEVFNNYNLAVEQKFNISENELHKKIGEVQNILQERLQNWLEITLNLSPNCMQATKEPSRLVVEQFLINAPYAKIKLR